MKYFNISKNFKKHRKGFGLFHCTYIPTKIKESRREILFFKNKFKIPIGFSDHFVGNSLAKKAKEFGATFFEKHVTLNPSDIGPDHKFAHTINDLNRYIFEIKKTKKRKLKNKVLFCRFLQEKKKLEINIQKV